MPVDLSTTYLGLKLRNPLVAAACPLTSKIDMLVRLEQSGAAAVVLPSLFEEQIEHEEMNFQRLYESGADAFAEGLSYFPEMDHYNSGTDAYLRHLKAAKEKLAIPVIASLNGTTNGGWILYAKRMEEAGADAIELNVYYVVTSADATSDEVERRYLDLVSAVKESVRIPVAVKIGPYFTALPHMVRRLQQVGADGVVLFNRFVQPDFDLQLMQTTPHLVLSNRGELRLPLRWIAILHGQVNLSLASSSGIHFVEDVIKVLLAGADVAMSASALLKHGPEQLTIWLSELESWLAQNEYHSVSQMKGSMSQRNCPDPDAFERANYMKALTTYVSEWM